MLYTGKQMRPEYEWNFHVLGSSGWLYIVCFINNLNVVLQYSYLLVFLYTSLSALNHIKHFLYIGFLCEKA